MAVPLIAFKIWFAILLFSYAPHADTATWIAASHWPLLIVIGILIAGPGIATYRLLKARAIAYTDPASGGTAGTYLANLFEKMGIAAELKPKTVLVKGGLAGEKLLTGEADIAMQPSSELLAVPGTVLVGPIPLDVQTYIIYSGAVSTGARNQTDADALLRSLWGPDKEAALKKKGMQLP